MENSQMKICKRLGKALNVFEILSHKRNLDENSKSPCHPRKSVYHKNKTKKFKITINQWIPPPPKKEGNSNALLMGM